MREDLAVIGTGGIVEVFSTQASQVTFALLPKSRSIRTYKVPVFHSSFGRGAVRVAMIYRAVISFDITVITIVVLSLLGNLSRSTTIPLTIAPLPMTSLSLIPLALIAGGARSFRRVAVAAYAGSLYTDCAPPTGFSTHLIRSRRIQTVDFSRGGINLYSPSV